jgi:hypothetical protein
VGGAKETQIVPLRIPAAILEQVASVCAVSKSPTQPDRWRMQVILELWSPLGVRCQRMAVDTGRTERPIGFALIATGWQIGVTSIPPGIWGGWGTAGNALDCNSNSICCRTVNLVILCRRYLRSQKTGSLHMLPGIVARREPRTRASRRRRPGMRTINLVILCRRRLRPQP